ATDAFGTTTPAATRNVIFSGSAPAIIASTGSATFFGNGGPILVDPGVQVPSNVCITGATVTITNFVAGDDVLSFTPLGNITGSCNAIPGVLTLQAVDPAAAYQAALPSVRFNDTSSNPTFPPRRSSDLATDVFGTTTPAATRNVTFSAQLPVIVTSSGSA